MTSETKYLFPGESSRGIQLRQKFLDILFVLFSYGKKKTALTVVMTGDERIVDDWQLPIGLLGSILFLDLFRGDFGFPILAESPSPVTY